MARNNGTFNFTIDADSLSNFKEVCAVAPVAAGKYAKADLIDFSRLILTESNSMVPVDTGTLAESAGYEVSKEDKDIYSATIGYGVTRDKTNPRTGLKASAYAVQVHEAYHYTPFQGYPATGEGKFLEKAFILVTRDFEYKLSQHMNYLYSGKLSARSMLGKVPEYEEKDSPFPAPKTNEGFTARHNGEYLPYPPNSSEPYPGKSYWPTTKTASSVRKRSAERFEAKHYGERKRRGLGFTKNIGMQSKV